MLSELGFVNETATISLLACKKSISKEM